MTVAIIPGIDTRAPERTDTRSGRAGSPSRLPVAASSRFNPRSTCSQSPGGCFRPAALYAAHASVVMVKPGGTGTPRFVISASSEPFPPSSGRNALEPSALPSANEYTYFVARTDGRADFFRVAPTTLARAISRVPPTGSGLSGQRKTQTRSGPG